MHAHDVGVVHLSGDPELIEKTVARSGSHRRWFSRAFDRNQSLGSAGAHGASEVDGAHAAAA